MFGKLKSIFQTIDVTAPPGQSGFAATRALAPESSFEDTHMGGDTSFGDTQIAPGHTNYYRCVCGTEWDGVWSDNCNDTCPSCGKDTAPKDD